MPKTIPFEKYAEQYDDWFSENQWVYEAEIRAVKSMIPASGRGVEIGVGTGRFAEPLGIKIGVDPSKRMGEIARKRGIRVLNGAWFSYGSTKLAQGKEKVREMLKENKELKEEIEAKIKEALGFSSEEKPTKKKTKKED